MVKDIFSRAKPTALQAVPPIVEGYSGTIVSTISTFTSGSLLLVGTISADWYVAIYATPSMSAGVMSPSKSRFRLIQASVAAVDPTPISFGTTYNQKFGPQAVGSLVYLRIVLIDSTSGAKVDIGIKPITVT